MSLLLARIAANHRGTTPLPANVMAYLTMAGADGGTTFTDLSANHYGVIANGGVQTRTTSIPAGGSGGGAALFDGSTGRLTLANHDELNNFGTGDFSIAAEVYCTDVSTERVIAGCVSSWTSDVAYLLEIRSGGDLRFYAGNGVPIQIIGGSGSLPANTWCKVKIERISGTTTLSVDGTTVGTPHTGSVTIQNATSPNVGVFPTDNTTPWKGYMRNFVITKG